MRKHNCSHVVLNATFMMLKCIFLIKMYGRFVYLVYFCKQILELFYFNRLIFIQKEILLTLKFAYD